ncbi:MAG: dihydroxy-acid dehydratase [Fimbriimonadaceae bacterium]|nr:dihydroxy-acid dehydratase [Fimbriimonadaceae bacterium]
MYVLGGEAPLGRQSSVADSLQAAEPISNGVDTLARCVAAAWNARNTAAFRSLLTPGVQLLEAGDPEPVEGVEPVATWLTGAAEAFGAKVVATPARVGDLGAVLAWAVKPEAAPERVAVAVFDQVVNDQVGHIAVQLGGEALRSAQPTAGAQWLNLDAFDCIRPASNPYSATGGLTILFGNLCPDGAVVKTAGVLPGMLCHSGPAVVFESQEEACSGILGGQVKAGDVVVIRYEGPRGGPGMQEMLAPTSYIKGMKLDSSVALITDGRFSGGTAGACIGHISPEAASGGLLGLVEPGDRIAIDIPAGSLTLEVDEATLAARRAAWTPPAPRFTRGYLARYTALATSASSGGVLQVKD